MEKTKKRTQNRKVPRASSETKEAITKPIYCNVCHKFLGYARIELGLVRIKCYNCKNEIEISTLPPDISTDKLKLRKVFCQGCGRYLFSEALITGVVKRKCRTCKEWQVLDISP